MCNLVKAKEGLLINGILYIVVTLGSLFTRSFQCWSGDKDSWEQAGCSGLFDMDVSVSQNDAEPKLLQSTRWVKIALVFHRENLFFLIWSGDRNLGILKGGVCVHVVDATNVSFLLWTASPSYNHAQNARGKAQFIWRATTFFNLGGFYSWVQYLPFFSTNTRFFYAIYCSRRSKSVRIARDCETGL